MFSWLGKNNTNLLGIDISSAAVKLLELSYSGNGYRVESYAVSPLSPGAVIEKTIKDHDEVVKGIVKTVQRAKSTATNVAISVPDSSVITKTIQLDANLKDSEMEALVHLEADKFVPYALDEVNIDFDIVQPSAKDPQLLDVLIVASRSTNVASRVAAIEEAGLKVKIVDVESFAMERSCNLLADQLPSGGIDKTIAVIDMGARMTNLGVLRDLKTIFTREEIFGGMQLTEQIQQRYDLSYQEAGRAKKDGSLPDDYETEVLMPFKETAVLQVRRALQFFFSTSQHSSVDKILLAGGTVHIDGLASMIEEQMGIPTMIGNPFAEMQVGDKVNVRSLTSDAPAMMICCGLAMRGADVVSVLGKG